MSSAVVTSGGAAEGELKASLLQDGEQPSGGGVNGGGAAVDTEDRRGRSSNWALACMQREFDHSAGIWVILLLELVAEASRGMVLPSMSSFITGPMGLSVNDVGTAVALFSAGRFCASLGLGWLSTRAAFRRVMVGALVAGMAGNLLYAITASSTPALLFLGRLLVGFSSGTLSVSRSALAAASSSETRLRVMAHLGAARFIGYALTPGLAVILQAAGTSTSNPFNLFRLPGWILVVADALVVVALFRYLPLEFGKHEEEEEVEEDPTVAALKALQAQGAMDAPQQPATAAVMTGEAAAAARSRSGTGASMSSISSLEATNSAVHSPNPAGGAASSPAGVRNEHRLSNRSTSSVGSRRRSSVSSLSSIKRASINSIASLVPPPPPPTSQDSKLVGRLRMGAVLGLFLCVNLLSRGVLSLMEAVGSRMYDKVIGDSDGDLQVSTITTMRSATAHPYLLLTLLHIHVAPVGCWRVLFDPWPDWLCCIPGTARHSAPQGRVRGGATLRWPGLHRRGLPPVCAFLTRKVPVHPWLYPHLVPRLLHDQHRLCHCLLACLGAPTPRPAHGHLWRRGQHWAHPVPHCWRRQPRRHAGAVGSARAGLCSHHLHVGQGPHRRSLHSLHLLC